MKTYINHLGYFQTKCCSHVTTVNVFICRMTNSNDGQILFSGSNNNHKMCLEKIITRHQEKGKKESETHREI